jgi:hypothetical protein
MWDMLILNSNVQSSRKDKNYLDLLAIEETRKGRRMLRGERKPSHSFAGFLGRFSRKIHL